MHKNVGQEHFGRLRRRPTTVRRLLPLALLFINAPIILTGCPMSQERVAFENGLEEWRAQRYADLREPDGYLSLAGLYWLEEGEHTFGSDSTNNIVFPEKAPPHMGSFVVRDSTVTMRIANGVSVIVDSLAATDVAMSDDLEGLPTIAHLDSLNWYVINRSRGLAIRLMNTESEARRDFAGIDFFRPEWNWRVEARYEPYDPPLEINMPSITGVDEKDTVPGAIVFEVGGTEYRLDVTGHPGDEKYFVVFGDATSGRETYGGGRFVWVDAEDEVGNIVIDFNRAYNPPCVFSPFATCPLPAANNRLPIRIEAGELAYGGH